MLSFSRAAALVTLVAATATLGACGFQLRGEAAYPPGMSVVYIDAADRYSGFYRELWTEFTESGLVVTEDPTAADTVFSVLRDETGQRVLSVSARNVPREYDVYYIVEYSVTMGGAEVLGRQRLALTRDYTWNERAVLGKALEEDTLRESLAADLVSLVRLRMASIGEQ